MGLKKPREQDLVNAVLEALQHWHVYAFRLNSGAVKTAHGTYVRLGPKGACDVVGILPGGRWLCLELKRDAKSKPTADQVAWIEGMRRSGAVCLVCRDVKELETLLRNEGAIK